MRVGAQGYTRAAQVGPATGERSRALQVVLGGPAGRCLACGETRNYPSRKSVIDGESVARLAFGAMGEHAFGTDIKRNADNQNRYRDVNERVMETNARFELDGERHRTVEVLCECGSAGCADRVEVTRAIYERLRADPETFVLTPGHEEGLVETVIERTPDYVIARNVGEAARIAVNGNPRQRPLTNSRPQNVSERELWPVESRWRRRS
jgi:hypothetical protein